MKRITISVNDKIHEKLMHFVGKKIVMTNKSYSISAAVNEILQRELESKK